MVRSPAPRLRGLRGLGLSGLLVLAPALGAWGSALVVWRTTTSGEATLDGGVALLRLAGLGCSLVLLWATAAVAAGVREGWGRASAAPVDVVGPPGQGPRATPRSVVSSAVAALVVAALTAPAASAHPVAPERPPVAEQPADPTDAPTHGPTDGPTDGPTADATDGSAGAVPGSWQALGQDAFSAPRGASPNAVSLVTSRSTRSPQPTSREVVVTAGDTLWGVVRDHLGPGASDADVARTWPAWWQANRSTIGDDPDLLLPGQRLVVPPPG